GSTASCVEIATGTVGSQCVGNVLRHPGKISNYGSYVSLTGASGQLTSDILIAHNYCLSDGSRQESAVGINGDAAGRINISENNFRDFTNSIGTIFLNAAGAISIEGNQFYNCLAPIWLYNSQDGILIKNNLMRDVLGG